MCIFNVLENPSTMHPIYESVCVRFIHKPIFWSNMQY